MKNVHMIRNLGRNNPYIVATRSRAEEENGRENSEGG